MSNKNTKRRRSNNGPMIMSIKKSKWQKQIEKKTLATREIWLWLKDNGYVAHWQTRGETNLTIKAEKIENGSVRKVGVVVYPNYRRTDMYKRDEFSSYLQGAMVSSGVNEIHLVGSLAEFLEKFNGGKHKDEYKWGKSAPHKTTTTTINKHQFVTVTKGKISK